MRRSMFGGILRDRPMLTMGDRNLNSIRLVRMSRGSVVVDGEPIVNTVRKRGGGTFAKTL